MRTEINQIHVDKSDSACSIQFNDPVWLTASVVINCTSLFIINIIEVNQNDEAISAQFSHRMLRLYNLYLLSQ